MSSKGIEPPASDEPGMSKSGRGLLKVPSRSYSQQRNQSSAASTGLSGATMTDRNSIGGRSRESKSSCAGRQRNGSASSNPSGHESDHGNTLANSQPSSPSTSDPPAANPVDDGENDNVQKVEKVPPRPTTSKARPQPALENVSAKQINEKETSQAEAITSDANGQGEGVQASGSGQNATTDAETRVSQEQKQPDPPAVTVDPPTAESQDEEPRAGGKSGSSDEDVEMQDAPPQDSVDPVVPSDSEKAKQKPSSTPPSPPPPDSEDPLASPPILTEPTITPEPKWLLPPVALEHRGRKCLVLDLDETLVHSSFKILHQADFTIPVEIEGNYHNVYVIKRPGVDEFMKRVGELYEVVVFTASVSKYGDPLLDQLDIHKVVHHRLFRESCYNHQGNYVKDLSQVGRDLKDTIIIDNSPTSYIFHPQHAVPISSWFSDAHDNELLDLIPVLEDLAGPNVADVSLVLDVTL
ncbi:hypothetical protein CDD82_4671 [Ophiocordyceps australis]|uniref:FCP1 homology domain-containing protein n=1 Tax=Ophiocordyceps australis TaxID=1399860 RepID=A0A2C5Y758_9HYPO|nr:hypothetical protein CDD82_4671 [Ophiocordyceps australis]